MTIHEDEDNAQAQFDPTAFQASCTHFLPPHQQAFQHQQEPHQRHQRRTPNCTHPLITVTVSVSGLSASSEVSASFAMALEESWDAVASTSTPLLVAPPVHSPSIVDWAYDRGSGGARGHQHQQYEYEDEQEARPREIQAQAHMGMEMGLGFTHDRKSEERVKDLSDVMRRVGLSQSSLIKDTSSTYAYCASEEVEGGSGWGWVGLGAGAGEGGCECDEGGQGEWEVEGWAGEKEAILTPVEECNHSLPKIQAQAHGSQSRMRFNSLALGMYLNPMSTAPAPASPPPPTRTHTYPDLVLALSPRSRPRDPLHHPRVPLPTEEDEENMEASKGRWFCNGNARARWRL
ncbi:hypothetical protein CVT25_002054 [Psilocybe cyanescens]|uniref:Uncharacterized protein n=1 Tax=Psilocybe cyanescens TaxID=93625 RepID=A0A409X9D0_PSICY|nr:hypothetical protein CVT25_002054 [Psilocybe cyanescens]